MPNMENKDFMAFTTNWNGVTNILITDVKISLPHNPQESNVINTPTQILDCKAIWDTGASSSVITKKIAQNLSLQPIGKSIVHTAGGTCNQDVFLVNIYLPNKVVMPFVRVTACDALAGGDVLIGMDIIASGDFAITNTDAKTTLSFRVPSIKKIDFVKEAERLIKEKSRKMTNQQKKDLRRKHKKERQAKKSSRKKKNH